MIVAMVAHAYENGLFIYHAASSAASPLLNSVAVYEAYKSFSEHPCVGKDGKIVNIKELRLLKSMTSFRRYMHRHYNSPLKVINYLSYTRNFF